MEIVPPPKKKPHGTADLGRLFCVWEIQNLSCLQTACWRAVCMLTLKFGRLHPDWITITLIILPLFSQASLYGCPPQHNSQGVIWNDSILIICVIFMGDKNIFLLWWHFTKQRVMLCLEVMWKEGQFKKVPSPFCTSCSTPWIICILMKEWDWSPCAVEMSSIPCLPRTQHALPLPGPFSSFSLSHLPLMLNQAQCMYGKRDSVSQVRAIALQLGNGQAAWLGRGALQRAGGVAAWRKLTLFGRLISTLLRHTIPFCSMV